MKADTPSCPCLVETNNAAGRAGVTSPFPVRVALAAVEIFWQHDGCRAGRKREVAARGCVEGLSPQRKPSHPSAGTRPAPECELHHLSNAGCSKK